MPFAGVQLGHYRLLRQVGGGNMGEVYLAEDTRIARQVAIKIIRNEATPYPDSEATKEAERLFLREMKAISLLDHPHILPLFDFGEEKVNGSPLTYMVMPYRPEGSLSDWLRQNSYNSLLFPEQVANLISQAADALQHAHDHQIIHQDVKPSNFLIRNRTGTGNPPDLLLTDFGIAKFASATANTSQSVRGTPTYMAPEQWDGHPVAASDQYGLAIMAYQLLTGRPPFIGRMEQVMRQHFTVQPQPPSVFNSRVSPAIDAVILRALTKKPEGRFPSIAGFADAFRQAVQAKGDLRATLSIRRDEALTGTSRTLTLPGGRKVMVQVPAGVQEGQALHLEGMGEPYYDGGPRSALILTINIAADEAIHLPFLQGSELMTAPSHLPAPPAVWQENRTPVPQASQAANIVMPPPSPAIISTAPRQGPSSGRIAALAIIALLIILAGTGLLLYHNLASSGQYGGKVTGTGGAGATATAQAAAATAPAATATAQVNATATAHAVATAQAATANPYPSYMSGHGTLALYDPLNQFSPKWEAYTDSNFGGVCGFSNGTYQISETKAHDNFLCNLSTHYSNFAIEVQMTILQGDCGGITFRNDGSNGKVYSFKVCSDGSYYLYVYKGLSASSTLTSNSSSAILTGANRLNTIGVVANGSTIELYANQTKLTSLTDDSYASGEIGLMASDITNATKVNYNNFKVWTF
jgi:serine/threonine protein kinase